MKAGRVLRRVLRRDFEKALRRQRNAPFRECELVVGAHYFGNAPYFGNEKSAQSFSGQGFCHGRLGGPPKMLARQDLKGLAEVLDKTSAGISAPELAL